MASLAGNKRQVPYASGDNERGFEVGGPTGGGSLSEGLPTAKGEVAAAVRAVPPRHDQTFEWFEVDRDDRDDRVIPVDGELIGEGESAQVRRSVGLYGVAELD